MKIKQAIVLLLCAMVMFSCSKDKEKVDNPQLPAEQDPHGSFDYSAISAHPRLLLKKGEEEAIKASIVTNPDLAKVHDLIINYCEGLLSTSQLKYQLEGKRLLAVSRNALKRIFFLSYAYRMTGKDLYSVRAEAEMLNVCKFPDWNPSHYLDVGEMAMGLSIGYDWLYDNLQPSTREKVREALLTKAIATSKDQRYNSWLQKDDNWNQVCNTGLLYAALATYETNKGQSAEMVERYLETIKKPLETYGPDGNYTEGYGYWAYGTGFQVLSLAALESAFGTDRNLSATPGFLKTGQYLQFMTGPADLSFNYSDSDSKIVANPFLFWFANKASDPSIASTEVRLLKNGTYLKSTLEDRVLPATLIFAKDFDLSNVPEPRQKVWIGHGDNPVAMVRTSWKGKEGLYLGIKGGMAANNHGHMDAGSFVYEAGGIRWGIDLGLQSYITLESQGVDLWNMAQNSQRWQVFRLNNYVHNTLTVNDKLHKVNGKASIIEEFSTGDKLGVKLNMTPVFAGELAAATREACIKHNQFLEITDELEASDKEALVSWRMCTSAEARIINNNTIELSKDAKKLQIIVDAPAAVTMKTWTNVPTNDYDQDNPGTMRVGFETTLQPGEKQALKVRLVLKN